MIFGTPLSEPHRKINDGYKIINFDVRKTLLDGAVYTKGRVHIDINEFHYTTNIEPIEKIFIAKNATSEQKSLSKRLTSEKSYL